MDCDTSELAELLALSSSQTDRPRWADRRPDLKNLYKHFPGCEPFYFTLDGGGCLGLIRFNVNLPGWDGPVFYANDFFLRPNLRGGNATRNLVNKAAEFIKGEFPSALVYGFEEIPGALAGAERYLRRCGAHCLFIKTPEICEFDVSHWKRRATPHNAITNTGIEGLPVFLSGAIQIAERRILSPRIELKTLESLIALDSKTRILFHGPLDSPSAGAILVDMSTARKFRYTDRVQKVLASLRGGIPVPNPIPTLTIALPWYREGYADALAALVEECLNLASAQGYQVVGGIGLPAARESHISANLYRRRVLIASYQELPKVWQGSEAALDAAFL